VVFEDLLAGPGNYERFNYTAVDVTANNPKFDPNVFTAAIPVGWLVSDQRTTPAREYVTMDDGTEQDIHTGVGMPHVHAGVAERPDGNTPDQASHGSAFW